MDALISLHIAVSFPKSCSFFIGQIGNNFGKAFEPFPKCAKRPKGNIHKGYKRFPKFPKCPETGKSSLSRSSRAPI